MNLEQGQKGINPFIELIANSSSTQAMLTVAMPLLAELVAEKRGVDKDEFVEKMWAKVNEINDSFTQHRLDLIKEANE